MFLCPVTLIMSFGATSLSASKVQAVALNWVVTVNDRKTRNE